MGADRDSCSWLLKDKLQLRIFRFGFRVYDDANEYTFQFARFFFHGGQSIFRNKSGITGQYSPQRRDRAGRRDS